jgi:putative ABC transport system substrate-binding protein
MNRRGFLGTLVAGLLATPLATEAQQVKKVARIAFIWASSPAAEITGPPSPSRYVRAFLEGMRALGWVDGQNITIEQRTVAGQPERYAAVAQELVAAGTDLIVLSGTTGVSKVRQVSQKIPIVVAGGVFVETGLAQSLAHPGGTVTGLTVSVGRELGAKRLQLLKEAAPRVSHVAVLSQLPPLPETETAARALNMTLLLVAVAAPEGFEAGFSAIRRARVGGILVAGSDFFWAQRRGIIEFAAREGLPAIYWDCIFAESGGLISYGSDYTDIDRRAASYVDKILRGAKPGDLPIEQPTKFELVLNLRTAKTLGLTIPQSLLLQADEVVQ